MDPSLVVLISKEQWKIMIEINEKFNNNNKSIVNNNNHLTNDTDNNKKGKKIKNIENIKFI